MMQAAIAQNPAPPARPAPPTRDPHAPGRWMVKRRTTILGLLSASIAAMTINAGVTASTLSPPATAEATPDIDGFIHRWLVLEPIPANGLTNSAVQALVKKESFSRSVHCRALRCR